MPHTTFPGTLAALVTAAALTGTVGTGAAQAAPKNYCNEVKGTQSGSTCTVAATDPAYTIAMSFPADFYDMKAVAEYVTKTRDSFVNAARATPDGQPHTLTVSATQYQSLVPPRGVKAVVLTTVANVTAPKTTYQSFNYDQAYRKLITFDTLWQKDADPLPVVVPYVLAELGKKTGAPVAVAPDVAYDPANYQAFAVTNDGVIFFFNQGTLLPDAAGPAQVLVPRSLIDPLLA